MQDRLPIPTDNIYKFYALFGLLLFVFACGATLYVGKSANAFLASAAVEIENLKSTQDLSAGQVARKRVLERLVEVEKSDKDFFNHALGGIAGIGVLLMVVGFGKWHSQIQPRQDELLDLQIRKLRAELRRGQRR